MLETVMSYWPTILTIGTLALGTLAAVHAIMTKNDVRAATGWIGVIILSPMIGPILYFIAGINRVRREALAIRRIHRRTRGKRGLDTLIEAEGVAALFGDHFRGQKILGDAVAGFALTPGNQITMLKTGDQAYARICEAIDAATQSIFMESYIFDHDVIGIRVAEKLIAAVKRGIEVRVLVDAIGARYTIPSIVGFLRAGGVRIQTFNGRIITGLRLPYANLRTHRKILIVDQKHAFTGGMNITKKFTLECAGDSMLNDTHFEVTGPVMADLFSVWLDDWYFVTGERLDLPLPKSENTPDPAQPLAPVLMRVVASGPDASLGTNQNILMGACSVARKSIHIMSPYFLPDRELISALMTAARRGVQIDIVVPQNNDFAVVNLAMTAQFDQVLSENCRIWRAKGCFNHSKLMSVDGSWAFIGSSNLDPRSLRLNFELDLEVFDNSFAKEIAMRITEAMTDGIEVRLADLKARPFALRLVERLLWLGSPYL